MAAAAPSAAAAPADALVVGLEREKERGGERVRCKS